MPQTGRRQRSRSTSDTYTLAELGRHWGLSRRRVVDRLCDEDTGVPLFYDTTGALDDVDRHGRQRSVGGAKFLRVTDLERVRYLFSSQPADEMLFLPLEGSDDPQLAERRTLRRRLRVKRADVEAYDKASAREQRRKGGKAPKRKPGIWQHVLDAVRRNPWITVAEAWESFPEASPGDTETLIYRDGDKLVEMDHHTGKERSITRHAFRRYVLNARKELRAAQ